MRNLSSLGLDPMESQRCNVGEKANSFQRGRKHQTCLIFLHAKHTHPGARALDRCHYNQSTICLLIIPVASGWAYDPFRKYILLVVSDRLCGSETV